MKRWRDELDNEEMVELDMDQVVVAESRAIDNSGQHVLGRINKVDVSAKGKVKFEDLY